MGFANNKGGCCTLGPRDYIIGPVQDVEGLVRRLSQRWGRPVARQEAVIDFEEGRQLFPERSTWQNPAFFPALRISKTESNPCRFYDWDRGCTIHEMRPSLCRTYECDWLRETLERVF
jgi:Fe-S-cluster containining protein